MTWVEWKVIAWDLSFMSETEHGKMETDLRILARRCRWLGFWSVWRWFTWWFQRVSDGMSLRKPLFSTHSSLYSQSFWNYPAPWGGSAQRLFWNNLGWWDVGWTCDWTNCYAWQKKGQNICTLICSESENLYQLVSFISNFINSVLDLQ